MDLSESLMLWLPAYLTEDEEAVSNVTKTNGLIMDFCDLDISLEQLLDEMSTMGVGVDNFRENLDFNLRQRGG